MMSQVKARSHNISGGGGTDANREVLRRREGRVRAEAEAMSVADDSSVVRFVVAEAGAGAGVEECCCCCCCCCCCSCCCCCCCCCCCSCWTPPSCSSSQFKLASTEPFVATNARSTIDALNPIATRLLPRLPKALMTRRFSFRQDGFLSMYMTSNYQPNSMARHLPETAAHMPSYVMHASLRHPHTLFIQTRTHKACIIVAAAGSCWSCKRSCRRWPTDAAKVTMSQSTLMSHQGGGMSESSSIDQ
jgi:hypothetical protein